MTLVVLLFAGGVAAKDVVVADFSQQSIEPVAGVMTIQSDPGDADPYLHYAASGKSKTLINLPVPKDAPMSGFAELTAKFRAGDAPDEVRWYAVDVQRRVLFQRRVTLPAGQQWQTIHFNFGDWRWGNESTGDWRDVTTLILQADSENPSFDLDAVTLSGDAPKSDDATVKLAFGDRARVVQKEGLLVATDATEQIPEPAQQAMLDRMVRAQAFLQRIAGKSYRPTHQPQPAMLLIFKEAAGSEAFYKALGQRWAASIVPPTEGGYTVQSIATSTWDEKQGPERPVYLHESVHAIAARDLRLLAGTPNHNALQEGLANYLQLVIYPKTLDAGVLPRQFAKPIGQSKLFKPLSKLLTERVTGKEYVQLASIVAYLVDKDPDLLAVWIGAVADGQSNIDALKAAGTPVDDLQDRWWKWGEEKYANPGATTHFETPAEFK
jgi:hypothetical protein